MIGWPKPSQRAALVKAERADHKPRSTLPRQRKPLQRTKMKAMSMYKRPEWLALRALAMLRAAGLCEHCRQKPPTEVHHLRYAEGKSGWRKLIVPLDWLLAVCRKCHEDQHPHMRPFDQAKV